MLLVPPVVRQQEVKSPCSGSSKTSRKFIKLLKRVLVLGAKEQVDGLSDFWIDSGAHKIVPVGVLFSPCIEYQV